MRFILLFSPLFFLACSKTLPPEVDVPDAKELAQQIPPHLRSNKAFNDAFDPGYEQEASSEPLTEKEALAQLPSNLPALPAADDITWTDPDNPDENLGSLEEVFKKPTLIESEWIRSHQKAQRLSYAEGKPLLVWFTDSRFSPTCKTLSRELLEKKDFKKWCDDNVIRLIVDQSPKRDPSLDPKSADHKLIQQKKYVDRLRDKFNIKGNPHMLVIGLNGETIGRYNGYRTGSHSYYWGRIQNAVKSVNDQHFNWRSKLDGKGYRNWRGKNGVELYAKLLKYHKGKLQVVEPNGRKTTFSEQNLSSKDQKWIKKQKAKKAA